ncbi:MAG: imidazole glycerol phosphate synthase subunit HisH [Steroidobacter sp.]
MRSVCILNYGSGNVKSVYNLFTAIESNVVISNDAQVIADATHLVLPGVGAFGAAMRKIHGSLPLDVLGQRVLADRKPFLGICVGMQVLATRGLEFEEHEGLGWVSGTVEKLRCEDMPLPHIGWNNATVRRDSPLLAGLSEEPDFYFVHSYAVQLVNPDYCLATTRYGEEFCSILQHENLYGVQFHPEKSQRAGLRLAKNFLSIK